MSPFPAWRQELFFKTPPQLQSQIALLKDLHQSRLNITNKSKDDDLLKIIDTLKQQLGAKLDLCVHYSLKFNGVKDDTKTLSNLESFYASLPSKGVTVLLCSGGGKKNTMPSREALQQLATKSDSSLRGHSTYVCFNPYLPDAKHREEERQHLTDKLSTGLCAGVYLQMGSDVKLLEAGLKYLREQIRQHAEGGCILGSIFMPSKQLLAQQKFRPWSGVFLSKEYLDSVDKARAITVQVLQLYKHYDVTPLVETAVRDAKALRAVMDVFEEAAQGL